MHLNVSINWRQQLRAKPQGSILLTWVNFNPNTEK